MRRKIIDTKRAEVRSGRRYPQIREGLWLILECGHWKKVVLNRSRMYIGHDANCLVCNQEARTGKRHVWSTHFDRYVPDEAQTLSSDQIPRPSSRSHKHGAPEAATENLTSGDPVVYVNGRDQIPATFVRYTDRRDSKGQYAVIRPRAVPQAWTVKTVQAQKLRRSNMHS